MTPGTRLAPFAITLLAACLVVPVLQAQPWPELAASYDVAAFEPVNPATPGPRESVYLGHGLNDIPGQPNEPANFLGSGFAVADVNGDGKNDLIAASSSSNVTGRSRAGSVWIWFGTGANGIRDAAGILGAAPDVRIIGGDADDAITSIGTGTIDTSVLATGDCTGDGVADLVLHSHVASGPGNTRGGCGEVYLFFGKANWPALIDLANLSAPARPDVVIYGQAADGIGDGIGGLFADLTGDGIDEVVIPAPGGDGGTPRNVPGEVLIFPGRAAAAWPAVIDLAVAGSAGTRVLGTNDPSGQPPQIGIRGGLAAADINGDNIDDLLIASRGVNGPVASRSDCGANYILFGRSTWPAFIDLDPSTAQPHADVRILGIDQADQMGGNGLIRTGDCDGDGLNDLVVAAELGDGPSNSRSGAGEAYIIWGRTVWPALLDLSVTGNVGVTIYGATAGGLSGDRITRSANNRSIAAMGDMNGDGRADLLLGAPQGDGPNETRTGAGEVYLILGRPRASWPAVIDALPTTSEAHPDCTIYGAGPQPGSGTNADLLSEHGTVAAGDVSGDGIDDILVAAPRRYLPILYQPAANTSHGMAFLIKGRTGAWPAVIDTALAASAPGGPDTSFRGPAYSRLGHVGALGMGDLDSDGGLDVILGAVDYSFYPDGNLGVAYDPGDRRLCGAIWAFAGATPQNWFGQAQAQLPALAATMDFTLNADGSVTFSYERDELLAQNVLYTAESSPDMVTSWTAMPEPPQIVSLGNGFEKVTHTFPAPAPSPLFGKVTVTPLP